MTIEKRNNCKTWDQTVRLWMGRLTAVAVFFVFLTAFLCRLSENIGNDASRAFPAALAVGVVSGLSAGVLIWKFRATGGDWDSAGFFVAGIIRSLIAFAGVVIICLFMDISLPWFLGWLGVFYTAFVALDIWLLICLTKDCRWKAQDF